MSTLFPLDPSLTRPCFWDRIGMAVSGICMVHCLILPVALAMLPLWPLGEALHSWLHPLFALLLIPTTLLAARLGYRKHRQRLVIGLLSAGLLLILIGGLVGHTAPGTVGETALTLSGSIVLIGGHWRNWRATAQPVPDHSPPL